MKIVQVIYVFFVLDEQSLTRLSSQTETGLIHFLAWDHVSGRAHISHMNGKAWRSSDLNMWEQLAGHPGWGHHCTTPSILWDVTHLAHPSAGISIRKDQFPPCHAPYHALQHGSMGHKWLLRTLSVTNTTDKKIIFGYIKKIYCLN